MLWNFKCFCNCQISSFSRHTCVLMLFSCQLVRIHVRNWAVRFLPKQDRLPPHFHSKTRQLGKNCKMVYCSFRQNLMGQFILLFATCVSVAVYEASVSPSFKYNTTYYPDNSQTKQFQMVVLHLMTKKTNYSYRVFVHVKKYAFKGPHKRDCSILIEIGLVLRLTNSCITS